MHIFINTIWRLVVVIGLGLFVSTLGCVDESKIMCCSCICDIDGVCFEGGPKSGEPKPSDEYVCQDVCEGFCDYWDCPKVVDAVWVNKGKCLTY